MEAPSNPDFYEENSNGSEEGNRFSRVKRRPSLTLCCPVCGITVRGPEIQVHLFSEMEKLYKVSNSKPRSNGKINSPSTSSTNNVNKQQVERETYQKVRSNRHRRQRIKTRRTPLETVVCPVCNKETTEEINLHVEQCLQKTNQLSPDSEDNIDVGDFSEYEWAGQSRVRATSLMHGGVSTLGTSICMTEEDELLVVDGDEPNMYGEPQYLEQDMIIGDVDGDNCALREAVVGSIKTNGLSNTASASTSVCMDDNNGDPVVLALKYRIRELENVSVEDNYKCLICLEGYKTPVVSTCCWHVHCEQCWLQTLGVKKLCPQCNMITSPTNLRRIYM